MQNDESESNDTEFLEAIATCLTEKKIRHRRKVEQ